MALSDLVAIPYGNVSDDVAPSDATPHHDDLTLEEVINEVQSLVQYGVDHIQSQFITPWEDAEALYNGATNISKEEGRSQVTATKVRDTIRAVKPSLMRVFVTAPKVAEYKTMNIVMEAVAEQQTIMANAAFWTYDGYSVLQDVIYDACVKGTAITKTFRELKETAEFFEATGLTQEQVNGLESQENVNIQNIYKSEVVASYDAAADTELLDVDLYYIQKKGEIKTVHVPLWSFFIDENADTINTARICGQRTNMTVSEARALGLEADWDTLESLDIETDDASGESAERRGFFKTGVERLNRTDISQKLILITECYVYYDLDNIGIAQLYRFWLGGISYEYIDHERVDEIPYDRHLIDIKPNSFFGSSLTEIVTEEQDTMTSLLRATCDNAHLSNNRRLAVHSTMVNMQDVINPKLGAPIRVTQPGMIQEIGVESQVGSMLALLSYLQQGAEVKTGVTAAASGLDPDALQSTGKEAVQNTIQLAQGQVELMARNLAETGLTGVFSKLLKLMIAHTDRRQVIKVTGGYQEVDLQLFNSDMIMHAAVGLGTNDQEMRVTALNTIYGQQKEVMQAYGPGNPLVSMDQMYNCAHDIANLMGVQNFSRYFTRLDEQQTAKFAEQLAEKSKKQAEQAQNTAQAGAYVEAAKIRTQGSMEEAKLKAQGSQMSAMSSMQRDQMNAVLRKMETDSGFMEKMLDLSMTDDLSRDRMAQELHIAGMTSHQQMVAEQNRHRENAATQHTDSSNDAA